MSFLFDRLYPASFKGAEYNYVSDSRSQGRRIVVHNYPGQSDDTEDLGFRNLEFTQNAVIKGFFYEDAKQKLEKALNSEGAGILIHPFLGSVTCVCLGFTVVEDTKKIGVARYTINFKEVKDKVYPIPSSDVSSLIADLYNQLYDYIKDYLNGEYIANFLKNAEEMAQKLRELTDFMNGIVSSAEGGTNIDKSAFQSSSDFMANNSFKVSSEGGDIGGNTSDIISNFDIISLDGQYRFDSSQKLFGFGEDDVILNFDTLQNNQNTRNKKIVNGSINTLALVNMYNSAVKIDFTDQENLDNAVNILNNYYEDLIDSDKSFLTNELLNKLNLIRIQSNKLFNQIKLQLPRIVEIETKPIPLAVLVYSYYGNTDNYQTILDLNNVFNPSRVSGTIKMLSE